MENTNQFSAQNPDRIKYWIKNNIHMVWDAVVKLQTIPNRDMVLKVAFYLGSYPIVEQYSKKFCSAEIQNKDTYVSEDMWLIDSKFSSINAFADWVNNVKS